MEQIGGLVLYDPERRWAPRAICRVEDWPYFFADGGLPASPPSAHAERMWDRAKEICAQCPALQECRRDTLGEEYGVWGGLDHHQRSLLRRKLVRNVRRWPRDQILAWGEHIHRLRKAGVSWSEIRLQSGRRPTAGGFLVDSYVEHLMAQPASTPKVVDLPLPEPAALPVRMAFPARPGFCGATWAATATGMT
ncbi:WhiB family transcriptional regulator [Streptomyces sp. ISL-100]|uniref:WhiB family transcriptional regulator n=1 Tax=Streptomyces sp. ISL-100 TaxID=2819173 RepID=UPI001BE8EDF7|nr:WhiB family transcriptional regulator [Streptomyces sp. ISL-100]MBT2398366.1 WhiB family transcriptional regulator [Streptomyces sp. ISL-100]